MENKYEKACKEFLRGCTCVDQNKQEQCPECLNSFCDHIRELAKEDNFKDVNRHCISRRGVIPINRFKKGDIKPAEGTPHIILGNCYINGTDIDQYIIDVVVKNYNKDGIIRKLIHKPCYNDGFISNLAKGEKNE